MLITTDMSCSYAYVPSQADKAWKDKRQKKMLTNTGKIQAKAAVYEFNVG